MPTLATCSLHWLVGDGVRLTIAVAAKAISRARSVGVVHRECENCRSRVAGDVVVAANIAVFHALCTLLASSLASI